MWDSAIERMASGSAKWSDVEAWLDLQSPQQLQVWLVKAAPTDPGDEASAARLELLRYAAGWSGRRPMESVRRLTRNVRFFIANGLPEEARSARYEAAGHMLELCCPQEAHWLLAEQLTTAGDRLLTFALAQRAKLATAMLDLGHGADALQAVAALTTELLNEPNLDSSRYLRDAFVAVLDVGLAAELARAGRIDTALADGVGAKADGAPVAYPPQAVARLMQLCTGQGALASLRDDDDVRSQTLVWAALGNEAGVMDSLHALTRGLSARALRRPAAWLRLGVAYRLVGRGTLASRCVDEAIHAATELGCLKWHRRALEESALIHIAAKQTASLADTWIALRRVDEAIGTARQDFKKEWQTLPLETRQAALTPPPAETRSVRAKHVHAALQALATLPAQTWSVEALATACKVSRRTLEQAIRQERNTTVSAVIREYRIELAVKMLEKTHLAIKHIAIDVGYSSSSAMCHELQRHLGKSPREIRLAHLRTRSED